VLTKATPKGQNLIYKNNLKNQNPKTKEQILFFQARAQASQTKTIQNTFLHFQQQVKR
jgi:hypothetical protein